MPTEQQDKYFTMEYNIAANGQNVKVNIILEHAMKVQNGSKSIALLFL
jgi:hypothetical protein